MAKKKTDINRVASILNDSSDDQPKKDKTDYSAIIDQYQDQMQGKSMGRPKKEKAKGRVKLTTQLNEDLIQESKIRAIQTKVSLADLIEDALRLYLNK